MITVSPGRAHPDRVDPCDPDDLTRAELVEAKSAVPDMPVLANTGGREDTVDEILAIADGLFVGTSLKRDGVTWNAVDPERASRFMTAAQRAREAVPV